MLTEFLDRLFQRHSTQTSSRETVKQRLQILLAHDRTDLSPAMVEQMRNEILQVVSRYVEIDSEGIEFLLENSDRATALIANLPIRRIRTEEQIAEEQAATLQVAEEDAAENPKLDLSLGEFSPAELNSNEEGMSTSSGTT
ncbi:MAG TPA: cell division topological specificity factor MinE [Synechococcales cyanobacterium M55_K2018_004]|nr:cell division topological specificity factor MinE [Synechococcales cyanobacterium M55_K2018_004]